MVGGGPAGLATALYARRRGLDVVVFEPRPAPIDKACGEGVMPPGVAALANLGATPAGLPFRGIRYRAGGLAVDGLFAGVHGLGVRRTALHSSLTAAASDISRIGAQVRSLTQDEDGVVVDGVRGRWLIGADGLHSRIRRLAGLDLPTARAFANGRGRSRTPRRPPRYGLRQHFGVRPWTDLVEVYWAPDCEAYVTPVGHACVGVAFLTNTRVLLNRPTGADLSHPYHALMARFPELAGRLAGVPVVSDVRGSGPLRQRVFRRTAGRVLLVGDAAGYVDPLTGEGIGLALTCARAAVDCLVRGRPDAYERAWRRITWEHRAMTSALLWCAEHPALRSRLVPVATRLPRVFTAAVNRLAK